jgi:hypothetical protein
MYQTALAKFVNRWFFILSDFIEYMDKKVTLDENVIELMNRLNVDRKSDTPQFSSKRPFGNSDYYRDVLEVIGRYEELSNEYGEISDEGKEVVEEHLDLCTVALEIFSDQLGLETGVYVETDSGWVGPFNEPPVQD